MQRLAWVLGMVILSGCAPMDPNEPDGNELIYPLDESVPSERCVNLAMLDSTEIIDDRNILFYMKGDDIYRNVLPRRCFGLQRNDAFSYRSNARQLCSVDLITVLQQFGGGLEQGASCQLGPFYVVSEAEVDAIKLEMERKEELGLN